MTYNLPPDNRTRGYTMCLNAACPDRERCLRALLVDQIPAEQATIRVVSPAQYPASGERCPHLRPAQKVRIAWGMSRMFDDMTRLTAPRVRSAVVGHFGRNGFYRARRGDRPILPADQQAIKRIFLAHGIEADPVYDGFTEDYVW